MPRLQEESEVGSAEQHVRTSCWKHLALHTPSGEQQASVSPFARLRILEVTPTAPEGNANMPQPEDLPWHHATTPSMLFAREWMLKDSWPIHEMERPRDERVLAETQSRPDAEWPSTEPDWERSRAGIFATNAAKVLWSLQTTSITARQRRDDLDQRRTAHDERALDAARRLCEKNRPLCVAAFAKAHKRILAFTGKFIKPVGPSLDATDPNLFIASLLHTATLTPLHGISQLRPDIIATIEAVPNGCKIGAAVASKWQAEASKARNTIARLNQTLDIVYRGVAQNPKSLKELRDGIGFELASFLSRAGAGTSRWFQWVPKLKSSRLSWHEMREAFLVRCGYSSAALYLERARYYGLPHGTVSHQCSKTRHEFTSSMEVTQHGLRCTSKDNAIASWHNRIRDAIHYAAKDAEVESQREVDLRVPVEAANGKAFIVDVRMAAQDQVRFVDVATVGEACKAYLEYSWYGRGAMAQKIQDRKQDHYSAANIASDDLFAFAVESSGLLSIQAMKCLGWIRQNGFMEGEVVAPRRWMFDTLNSISGANAKGLAQQHIFFAKHMGPGFNRVLRAHLRSLRPPRQLGGGAGEAAAGTGRRHNGDPHAFEAEDSVNLFERDITQFSRARFLERAGYALRSSGERSRQIVEEIEAELQDPAIPQEEPEEADALPPQQPQEGEEPRPAEDMMRDDHVHSPQLQQHQQQQLRPVSTETALNHLLIDTDQLISSDNAMNARVPNVNDDSEDQEVTQTTRRQRRSQAQRGAHTAGGIGGFLLDTMHNSSERVRRMTNAQRRRDTGLPSLLARGSDVHRHQASPPSTQGSDDDASSPPGSSSSSSGDSPKHALRRGSRSRQLSLKALEQFTMA